MLEKAKNAWEWNRTLCERILLKNKQTPWKTPSYFNPFISEKIRQEWKDLKQIVFMFAYLSCSDATKSIPAPKAQN